MGISRDSWHKRRHTGAKRVAIRMKRKFELGRQPANTRLGERRVHTVRCRGGFMKFRALRLDHGNYSWPLEAVTRKTRILGVVYNATSMELVRTNTLVQGTIVEIDATPFRNWYQKHYGVVIGKVTGKDGKERKPRKDKKKGSDKKAEKDKKKKAEKKGKKEEKKETTEKKGAEKKGAKKGKDEKKGEKKVVAEKKGEKKGKDERKESKPKVVEKKKKVRKHAVLTRAQRKIERKKQVERKERERTLLVEKKKKDDKKKKGPGRRILKKLRLRNLGRVLEDALNEQFERGKLLARISTRPGQCGAADGYILEGEELAFYQKKIALKKDKKK